MSKTKKKGKRKIQTPPPLLLPSYITYQNCTFIKEYTRRLRRRRSRGDESERYTARARGSRINAGGDALVRGFKSRLQKIRRRRRRRRFRRRFRRRRRIGGIGRGIWRRGTFRCRRSGRRRRRRRGRGREKKNEEEKETQKQVHRRRRGRRR